MKGKMNMNICYKDKISQEIIENERKFKETTYLLLKSHQLSYEELDDYFKRYQQNINKEEFLGTLDQYEDFYTNLEERAIHIINSQFLRYYVKDLKKRIPQMKSSQKKIMKAIAYFIVEIINEVSYIVCQNMYKENDIEIFEESVNEEHLKEEFYVLILKILKPILLGQSSDISEKSYLRLTLYKFVHAQYIVELFQEHRDENKLYKLKQKINEDLSLSNDDVELALAALESYKKKELEKIICENTKTESKDYHSESQEKVLSLKLNNNSITAKLSEIYDQYYATDRNKYAEFENAMFKYMRILTVAKKIYDCHIQNIIGFMLLETDDMSDDIAEVVFKINSYGVKSKEYVVDFLSVLCFSLWHVPHFKEREKRIEKFKKLIEDHACCHDEFFKICDKSIEYDSKRFLFTPHDLYNSHIVLAVINCLDIPLIARKVKKFILSFYEQDYDLKQRTKELTYLYETQGYESNLYNLSEYADLFLLSYIKDPECLTRFSPFVRIYKQISEHYTTQYLSLDKLVSQSLNDENKNSEFFDIYMYLQELKNKYLENKQSFCWRQQLDDLMAVKYKTSVFYHSFDDFDKMLDKHLHSLIAYIYRRHSIAYIKSQTMQQQISLLYFLCLFMEYIDIIDGYHSFIPQSYDLDYDKKVKELNQRINQQNELLEQQAQEIQIFQHKQSSDYQNFLRLNQFKKELKIYQQDIVFLNKQLNEKDVEIQKLKNQQKELYKLRELMFSMQQQAESQPNLSIDLSEIIKGKKIITIGGHHHLREKMKQKYPSIKTLSQISHITDAVLLNADHVFIFYNFLSHGMYQRAISYLSKNNIPWDYVPYTNLEKSENLMYEILTRS